MADLTTANSSREALYKSVHAYMREAMVSYGGHRIVGGGLIDAEAWREANLDDLLSAIMTMLRAGLNPKLDAQAVEDGSSVARALYAPARHPGSGRAFLHECGLVEWFPESPDCGGCDACESGSDAPSDWEPLYIRRAAP
jgi:hypothetical protein